MAELQEEWWNLSQKFWNQKRMQLEAFSEPQLSGRDFSKFSRATDAHIQLARQ